MRKLILTLLVTALLTAFCLPAFCFDASTPPARRNAVLFCWDGVQRDHLNECLKRGELPNLAALIEEGGMVNIDVTSHNTDTKAGHAQMLTGYDPDVTGVMSNGKFKAIPTGYSIFERLDQTYGKNKLTTIMLTGKGHHIGACPPSTSKQITEAQDKISKLRGTPANDAGTSEPGGSAKAARKRQTTLQNLNAIVQNTDGEPFLNTVKALDVWDGEKARDYDVVGPLMLGYLDKYGKDHFFAFFHYSDPDHMGHDHGENSKEYSESIITCDKMLGDCVKKLKALGIYDETMIFATADHGFDEDKTSHKNAPYVTLAANLKSLTKSGDQRDIVPTILAEMGVDISKIQPKFKGIVLTK